MISISGLPDSWVKQAYEYWLVSKDKSTFTQGFVIPMKTTDMPTYNALRALKGDSQQSIDWLVQQFEQYQTGGKSLDYDIY